MFKFGHDQVATRIGCGGDLISSPLFLSFPPPTPPAIQRVIATELNSSLKRLTPSVGMLRLSLILVARGHRYDRGSVSIANGLCITFGNVLSSNVYFCLPVWEGEKQADDKLCNTITYV